jgi:hypothetical protein
MNQVTNTTQYKNIPEEEQAGFDFEGYRYEIQNSFNGVAFSSPSLAVVPFPNGVYRLAIQPDKYYYIEWPCDEPEIRSGNDIMAELAIDNATLVRPATEAELPEPKPETLEDRVKAEYPDYDVVMLEWGKGEDSDLLLMVSSKRSDWVHVMAQGMKGFYRYAYFEDGRFSTYIGPSDVKTGQTVLPIAALFARGEG